MPYYVESAILNVEYKCSKCGASGYVKVDGDEYVGNLFGAGDFSCPSCGLDLTSDYDLDLIDDEYGMELEEEEE